MTSKFDRSLEGAIYHAAVDGANAAKNAFHNAPPQYREILDPSYVPPIQPVYAYTSSNRDAHLESQIFRHAIPRPGEYHNNSFPRVLRHKNLEPAAEMLKNLYAGRYETISPKVTYRKLKRPKNTRTGFLSSPMSSSLNARRSDVSRTSRSFFSRRPPAAAATIRRGQQSTSMSPFTGYSTTAGTFVKQVSDFYYSDIVRTKLLQVNSVTILKVSVNSIW